MARLVAANAYIGAEPLVEALRQGADMAWRADFESAFAIVPLGP